MFARDLANVTEMLPINWCGSFCCRKMAKSVSLASFYRNGRFHIKKILSLCYTTKKKHRRQKAPHQFLSDSKCTPFIAVSAKNFWSVFATLLPLQLNFFFHTARYIFNTFRYHPIGTAGREPSTKLIPVTWYYLVCAI